MKRPWILPVPEYYARMNGYIVKVGLPYSQEDVKDWASEEQTLRAVMGDAAGRSALDCSCGWGKQAIALAKLGWCATATDVSDSSMDFARRCAGDEKVDIAFRACDMRDLGRHFQGAFDWAVSCFALYELQTDEEIRQALYGVYAALKPSGQFYVRLRDMDFLMEELPRHVFKGEKRVENGRIICIEDWDYESDTHVVALEAFLREDETRDPGDHFRWTTETIGVRKRVLRKAELERLLRLVGFEAVTFLPQPAPWVPFEVVASKPKQCSAATLQVGY